MTILEKPLKKNIRPTKPTGPEGVKTGFEQVENRLITGFVARSSGYRAGRNDGSLQNIQKQYE